MQQKGFKIGGFNCYLESRIPAGGGLSSSAAFEVLIALVLSFLYNDDALDLITAAEIGQAAENNYFGKPSGLMDQIACAVGGFLSIDFKDPENPFVEKIPFDFNATNHTLCLVKVKRYITEHVIAYFRHHNDICAGPVSSYTLVGSFSAGPQLKLGANNRFTWYRQVRCPAR
jgi:galactokinase